MTNKSEYRSAQYYSSRFQLQPHPEGGSYRETYRATKQCPLHNCKDSIEYVCMGETRPVCTGIYYMLSGMEFSAFHRIDSDEMWHYYDGNVNLVIHELNLTTKEYKRHELGRYSDEATFQCVVPAGSWFSAELLYSSNGYIPHSSAFALCGCTVSPGFTFKTFELAQREELLNEWNSKRGELQEYEMQDICKLIKRLTRK
jgi:predicted cupin superfamily sugar epimerase